MSTTSATTQIYINGAWVSRSTLVRTPISITGGRKKDAVVADPLNARCELRNDDGALSTRNPRSPYFGLLGRGTRARIIVPDDTHLWISQLGDTASTPDHASLDITGDIDLRIELQPWAWAANSTGGVSLGGKYVSTGNQRSWLWWVGADLTPSFRWTSDGTFATAKHVVATAPIVPPGDQRISLRLTLDVDNGAGGWTGQWYTGTGGVDGSWTPLGDPVTEAGVTSIYASTAPLVIGGLGLATDAGIGRIQGMQMRSGIGGSVVAGPDFTAQAGGVTSFADSAGRTWTLSGAELRDFDIRASGEVANWPTEWVVSGRKKWASIEIGSWLRYLARPSDPLRSPLFRASVATGNLPYLLSYHSFEDATESTSLASGIGGPSATWKGGTPELASSETIPGSDPLLVLTPGVFITCPVSGAAGTGQVAFRMVADVPATGLFGGEILATITVAGSAVSRWLLLVVTGGSVRLRGVAPDGSTVVESGVLLADIFGRRQLIGFDLVQNGADIDWYFFVRRIGTDLDVLEYGANSIFSTVLTGRPLVATISDGTISGVAVGHVMVGENTNLAAGLSGSSPDGTLIDALAGYAGERAAYRLLRLADELGIPIRIIGDPADTELLGPQPSGNRLDLFRACALADRGLLGEVRDEMCLVYDTRMSLYNRTPRVTLAYGTEGESPTLTPDEPVEDVVNTYTASRRLGSQFVATEPTGRLGAADYPTGLGSRPGGDELQVEADTQLEPAAWWETHLGTWDESRYQIELGVSRLDLVAGKTALAAAAAAAMPGDRILIASGVPDDLSGQPIDVQMSGWEETIQPSTTEEGRRTLRWSTVPGRPWQVGVVDEDFVDSEGTTLVADIDDDDVSFQVAVVGTPWETGVTSFIAVIRDAERVTVTDITGSTSPQTWTVTRALDGIAVAHPAGAAITLYRPLRWAR